MKVILKSTNQVKEVPYGYAANYLFPRGLAIKATEDNLQVLEKQQKVISNKQKAVDDEDQKLAAKLDGQQFVIQKKSQKNGQIFGSVNKKEILSQLSVSADRVEALLDKPIKKLGEYEVNLKIGQSRSKIKLKVISK